MSHLLAGTGEKEHYKASASEGKAGPNFACGSAASALGVHADLPIPSRKRAPQENRRGREELVRR